MKFKSNETEITLLWKQIVASDFVTTSKKETELATHVKNLRN